MTTRVGFSPRQADLTVCRRGRDDRYANRTLWHSKHQVAGGAIPGIVDGYYLKLVREAVHQAADGSRKLVCSGNGNFGVRRRAAGRAVGYFVAGYGSGDGREIAWCAQRSLWPVVGVLREGWVEPLRVGGGET